MGAKDAHLDGNQQFSIIGVQGTAGTADTKGTAETLPIGVHKATGAMYTYDLNTSEEVTTGFNGGTVAVGTTAVAATFTGKTQSISLMSDADNTGKIWFGGSSVSSDGSAALGRLTPDRAITVDLDDSNAEIYLVSDTAGQVCYKMALT